MLQFISRYIYQRKAHHGSKRIKKDQSAPEPRLSPISVLLWLNPFRVGSHTLIQFPVRDLRCSQKRFVWGMWFTDDLLRSLLLHFFFFLLLLHFFFFLFTCAEVLCFALDTHSYSPCDQNWSHKMQRNYQLHLVFAICLNWQFLVPGLVIQQDIKTRHVHNTNIFPCSRIPMDCCSQKDDNASIIWIVIQLINIKLLAIGVWCYFIVKINLSKFKWVSNVERVLQVRI